MKILKCALIFLFTISTYLSYSQSSLQYGIGVNLNQNFYRHTNKLDFMLRRTDWTKVELTMGFNLRLTYGLNRKTELSISPGLRFFRAYSLEEFTTHGATFIDLPLQINYEVIEKLFLIGGVNFNYLTKLERKGMSLPAIRNDALETRATSRLFFIGKIGFGTPLFKDKLLVELSYNYSFQNLLSLNSSAATALRPATYKNNYIQAAFIYKDLSNLFD